MKDYFIKNEKLFEEIKLNNKINRLNKKRIYGKWKRWIKCV